ncbi:hypothetical protein [Plasmodium yoelii yoelii]|uniref:Uncharacterized protein n=1 Tax=Plasmodium yoelii yoelii TaxID=73239 RepID=Q7RQ81_PLAYO|nr:hypothetical protein [Plasmodium yoelii yoelii]
MNILNDKFHPFSASWLRSICSTCSYQRDS